MAGIITKKINEKTPSQWLDVINDPANPKSFLAGEDDIFIPQVQTAMCVIKSFDDCKYPRENHIIIRGKTQAGKTGVLSAVICLISELGISKTLDINSIYYLTGDNTTKLKEQSEKRLAQIIRRSGLECYFLKNSDMSKDSSNNELSNCLIFVDESHYGTKNEKNVLIKWLDRHGLDLKNQKTLSEKKVYIISNTATPSLEILSDTMHTKQVINLITEDWPENDDNIDEKKSYYIGFEQFLKLDGITGGFYNHGEDYPRFDVGNMTLFSDVWARHLEKFGHKKCGVVRLMPGMKNSAKIVDYFKNETEFDVVEINSTRGNIDYDGAWYKIQNFKPKYGKNFLIVFIKGSLRMGITIPPHIKSFIGFIYDYSGSKKSKNTKTTELITTEQALLGRICGYWPGYDKSWKNILIFINSKHIEPLKRCYVDGVTQCPTGSKTEEVFVEDENGDKYGVIEDEANVEAYFPFDENSCKKYNLDFIAPNGKYGGEIESGLAEFLKTQKSFFNDEKVVCLRGRRNLKEDGSINNERKTPKFEYKITAKQSSMSNQNQNKIRDNVEKYGSGQSCYTTLIKFDELENGVAGKTGTVIVKFGKCAKGKYQNIYSDVSDKPIKTLDTSLTK